MSHINHFNTINWHDAILLKTEFICEKNYNIIIQLNAYNKADNKRQKTTLTFTEVNQLTISANTHELNDNATAGNINHAYIKHKNQQHQIFFYLIDGYINFSFKTLHINNLQHFI